MKIARLVEQHATYQAEQIQSLILARSVEIEAVRELMRQRAVAAAEFRASFCEAQDLMEHRHEEDMLAIIAGMERDNARSAAIRAAILDGDFAQPDVFPQLKLEAAE